MIADCGRPRLHSLECYENERVQTELILRLDCKKRTVVLPRFRLDLGLWRFAARSHSQPNRHRWLMLALSSRPRVRMTRP